MLNLRRKFRFASLGMAAVWACLVSAGPAAAAIVQSPDITVSAGATTVDVPVSIESTFDGEFISGLAITIAIGQPNDGADIIGATFAGSVWTEVDSLFGLTLENGILAAQAIVAADPFQIPADGLFLNFTIDTSELSHGGYLIDLAYQGRASATVTVDGMNYSQLPIVVRPGLLNVASEGSSLALGIVAGVFGWMTRRRWA